MHLCPQHGRVVQLAEDIVRINEKKAKLLLQGVLSPHKAHGVDSSIYTGHKTLTELVFITCVG